MLVLLSAAFAAPVSSCARPITSAELVDAADRAEARFADQDELGFAEAQAEVVARLGCVADPLSPSDVVRVQRVVALGAFMKSDEPGMRAAVAGMLQVDIGARFPEAVVPSGHKLDKLLDELAGAPHAPGAPLRVFPDGWIEVNGSYAPTVQVDVAATLQHLDNQGAVVETRYWMAGAPLEDWAAAPDAPPAVATQHTRPPPKVPVSTGGVVTQKNDTSTQIARENAAARHVALVVSTSVAAVASGVVYALAADAKATALDPAEPLGSASAMRDQANGLTWGWIGGTVLSVGLGASLVVTW